MKNRLVLVCWLGICVAAATWASEPSKVKLVVDRPGTYEIQRAEPAKLWEIAPSEISRSLVVAHDGQAMAAWVDGASEESSEWSRLIFTVPSSFFEEQKGVDFSPLVALSLQLGEQPLPDLPARSGIASPTALRHRILLEENLLRAPLETKDVVDGVDSQWFWAIVSHRQSAVLTIDLDPFLDLRPGRLKSFEVRARFLARTYPDLPPGVPQHQVNLVLNGHTVGSDSWNGRLLHTMRVPSVDAELLREHGNLLQIKVPERFLPGASPDEAGATPIIDLSYVDRVEIFYEAIPHAGPSGKSVFPAVDAPWPEAKDGWVLPTAGASKAGSPFEPEAFLVGEKGLQRPLQMVLRRSAPPTLPAVDYLAVGPEHLLHDVEPLLRLHRRRGLRAASVAAEDLFDSHGNGLRNVAGIRNFLLQEHERHGALKYVLLIGDANWFSPGERPVGIEPEGAPGRRAHWIPAGSYISPYGPATSDHVYAVADANEATPRYAVGRLPVATPEELSAVVGKLLKAFETPIERADLLMLSGLDKPSQGRLRRMSRRLGGALDPQNAVDLRFLPLSSEQALDQQVLEGFSQEPTVIYFAGHGSRHLWGLGGAHEVGETVRLTMDDLRSIEPPSRLPVVLSISCATAPFDHPSAGSLGEAMLLDPHRGAVAFVGASATLYTPPRFTLELLEGFLQRRLTLGEALIEAKATVNKARFSHLYNLLGDPAFPLFPDRSPPP